MVFRFWLPLILAVFLLSGSLPGGEGPYGYAASKKPVTLTLEPTKRIYSAREGVSVKFTFHANQRTKLCLSRDILTQMQLRIARSGTGVLPLQPLVVRDNSELFAERRKIYWLKPGQRLTLRANVRRFQLNDGETWKPGDYSVLATFGLCAQTPDDYDDPAGEEIPIPSDGLGWFMIMS